MPRAKIIRFLPIADKRKEPYLEYLRAAFHLLLLASLCFLFFFTEGFS
jgi:hypothetical protein